MRAMQAQETRRPNRRPVRRPSLAIALALFAGCSPAPPPQSALLTSAADIEMPTIELRLRVYGFAEQYVNGTVVAADRILEATNDPGVSRNALRWKTSTLVNAQLSAFALDPLIALRDMWTLAIQMRQFFETGAGKDAFGAQQPIALETVRDLERQAYEFVASVSTTAEIPANTRQEVEAYAAAHPLTDMALARSTATAEFASELATDRTSGLAVLADLNVQVGDLSERLKYYAAVLPEQIRWQSELLFLDILTDEEIRRFFSDVEAISDAAVQLADLADSLTTFVDAQARAVVAAMAVEVAASLQEVDRQRIATLDELTAERVAVMEGLTAERVAVMEGLAAIADSTLRRAPMAADEVVDYAFGRALALLGLIFFGGLVFAFLLRLIWKRPATT